jgi:hypothetical protein
MTTWASVCLIRLSPENVEAYCCFSQALELQWVLLLVCMS